VRVRRVKARKGKAAVIIMDSFTLGVSTLLRIHSAEQALGEESMMLARVLAEALFDSIVVTDEVGSGIVPENAAARRYRDLLGLTNQEIGRAADEIILMVSGYPLRVK